MKAVSGKKIINRNLTEQLVMVFSIVAILLISTYVEILYLRYILISLVFIVVLVFFGIYSYLLNNRLELVANLLNKNAQQIDRYIHAMVIPTAITTKNGKIVWHNPAFMLISGSVCTGKNIFKIFPQAEIPDKNKRIIIDNETYIKETFLASNKNVEYVVYRFIDSKNSSMTSDIYKGVMATVCHVQIDNYEDLMRALPKGNEAHVRSQIESIITKTAENVHGVYQRYDKDKYILFFERKHLMGLMQGKFPLLKEARDTDIGAPGYVPTLSMGIGLAKTPDDANWNALKALEMALGRGGDQAVLKDESEFKFYGGIQQGREKRAKVKARMFANALKNLMEQSNKVIIMGHTAPDLDCMGAALGLVSCAWGLKKKVYIVLDKSNSAIDALVEEMQKDPDYKNVIITPQEAHSLMDNKTTLIVVDTQIASFTLAPSLLKESVTTVVLDHHLRGTGYIEQSTLFLHEPYASSTAEMVTEIIQYFAENISLKPLAVETLLAGISIDTKGFTFKTGERTFEAASYLRRMGADTTKIRQLFKDDLQTFSFRSDIVRNAEVLENGIAVSICSAETQNAQIIAAQAADALIGIRGISASFVLCKQDNVILISGRSLGEINVQRILEKMGGGGHATIAGAQIKGKSINEVDKILKEKIMEYEKEIKE